MNDEELVAFLDRIAEVYFHHYDLPKDVLTDTIKELDAPKLLSLRTISAIVGAKIGTVRRIAGSAPARPRGFLNPSYVGYLKLILTHRTMVPELYEELLVHGTSISTIALLTNVSEATLYRWRKK